MEQEPTPELGRIEVAVPHWAATVTVCDPQLRPVVELDTVQESPDRPGVYEAAGAVAAGIYQVEVTLGEQQQRELVGVMPGQTARVGRDRWRLEFTSVAPLAGFDDPRLAAQRAAAEEVSRRPTWTSPAGASSRLFLFVRTMDPKRYPRFADGLQLLDVDHRPVVDIYGHARTSDTDGWLAFTGELPAGYYVLRRGRAGVPVRYQPIYLHAGWTTQVFLAARGFPSLRKLSMAMAPLGTGFKADDETVMATEAVLASLDSPGNETPIVNNRKLAELLRQSHVNPWLDVTAAYSLRGWLSSGERSDSSLTELLGRLVGSVARIGDHPDARALQLTDDEPAEQPFWQPPLLRAGLARVNQHATRYAGTVPLDSLTDCVLDNVVTNSMWTAWHSLDREPRPADPTPTTADRPVIKIRPPEEPPPLSAIGPALASATLRFLAAPGSAAPVADDAAEIAVLPGGAAATPGPADRLLLASLVTAVEELIADYGFDTLPDQVSLSPARQLDDQLAQLEPAAVSAASGLSLARTEDGVKQLRQRLADDQDPAVPTSDAPLPPAQREIVRYALLKSRPPTETADTDEAVPDPAGSPTPDEVVTGLRAEENRLRHRADDTEWVRDGNPDTARELADRLQRVADELLKGAEFIALTVPDQQLILGNGAFDDLVGQPAETPTGQVRAQERRRSLSAWGRSLARQQPGHSVLSTPAENRIATEWELQRSALVAANGQPHAYLNMLRGTGASPSGPPLERAHAALSEIRTYTSLYAYGSDTRRDEYAERLRGVVEQLESAMTGP